MYSARRRQVSLDVLPDDQNRSPSSWLAVPVFGVQATECITWLDRSTKHRHKYKHPRLSVIYINKDFRPTAILATESDSRYIIYQLLRIAPPAKSNLKHNAAGTQLQLAESFLVWSTQSCSGKIAMWAALDATFPPFCSCLLSLIIVRQIDVPHPSINQRSPNIEK
jgi:hypothetical protein